MKFKAIGHETQIEDCLFGQNSADKESLQMKVDFTVKHIDKIISLNGSKIYHPIVKGNDIFYFLSKAPSFLNVTDKTERKYYYPIQYAEIVFFNNKP